MVHDYGTVKFEVGEAELYNLPPGIDFAVKKMQRNEIARIATKVCVASVYKIFLHEYTSISNSANIMFVSYSEKVFKSFLLYSD